MRGYSTLQSKTIHIGLLFARIVDSRVKTPKEQIGIMYELIRAARANKQPICTCKYSAFLHVQTCYFTSCEFGYYVVLFVVNIVAKDDREKVFQPKREELELLNGICLEE